MEHNELIKRRREELGLSLQDVAGVVGVSKSTIFRYETNDINKMPIDTIGPLAKALKCHPLYIMGYMDEPNLKTNIYDSNFNKAMIEFISEQKNTNNYTVEYFSNLLGITESKYLFYENGKGNIPMSVFMNVCLMQNLDYVEEFKKISDKAKLYTMRGEIINEI